jgi:iron-sulfur cluster repair protein YtfE (RIC family)
MSTIEQSITQSHVIQRIMQEHDQLRNKLRQVHSALSERKPESDEIGILLHEFLNALLVHFEKEENDGFFARITAEAPYLSKRAALLCQEHRKLLHEAKELCQFASAGSPSLLWWRELSSRCHVFSIRIMRHEHEENQLLREARQVACGDVD